MNEQKSDSIASLARKQAERWQSNPYYADAEGKMERQWTSLIHPIIRDSDFSVTVDLAAGHGRNSQFLLPLCDRLYIADIHQENIDACRQRFGENPKIHYVVNSGSALEEIPDNSVTFIYCFDAMVHFHSDVIRSYLRDFQRILRAGGTAFCHHSNSTNDPGGLVISRHVRGRNFMSREMFMHYCVLEGFEIISSQTVDWAGEPKLDCLSYFRKPI